MIIGSLREAMLKRHKGQIALVVLLIMVVMLTLGVSIAQRGLLDVRISQQEEDSARAFQAAETGIEKALQTLAAGSGEVGGDASYDVEVSEGGENGFVTGESIRVGEAVMVDLAGSSGLTTVEVYFGDESKDSCDGETPPAIEVVRVDESGGETELERYPFDLTSRDNSFEVVAGGGSFYGKTFCGKASVGIGGDSTQLRIKPWYAAATIGAKPNDGGTLANQYRLIRSVGETESGSKRAVEVQRTDPVLPPIFDYVLFSGSNISK
jgi:hypothetical protein